MFFDFFKRFKHEKCKPNICPHPHLNVNEFFLTFDDPELNSLRVELVSCQRNMIDENINEILFYLKDKCTEEDYAWISEEIKKEYKK